MAFPKLVLLFAALLFVIAIITGCGHQPPGENLWLVLR